MAPLESFCSTITTSLCPVISELVDTIASILWAGWLAALSRTRVAEGWIFSLGTLGMAWIRMILGLGNQQKHPCRGFMITVTMRVTVIVVADNEYGP